MGSLEKIKELRARTNVSVGVCKKALEASGDDIEKAIEYLRVAGELRAQDLVSRKTTSGAVVSYIHPGNLLGVMLQVECETDFVAKSDDFLSFCRDVAMHIAASRPAFIQASEAAGDPWWAGECDIITSQMKSDVKLASKTPAMFDKIYEGKCAKALKEACLLDQPFVKDTTKTVGGLLGELVLRTGESTKITQFRRFDVKEGK